jgi:hypothetical protein
MIGVYGNNIWNFYELTKIGNCDMIFRRKILSFILKLIQYLKHGKCGICSLYQLDIKKSLTF